jgi:hypothetical protein
VWGEGVPEPDMYVHTQHKTIANNNENIKDTKFKFNA